MPAIMLMILGMLAIFTPAVRAQSVPARTALFVLVRCQDEMRSRLTSPRTADFQYSRWSHRRAAEESMTRRGDTYTFVSTVRAKNAFGGTVPTVFVCEVTGRGDRRAGYHVTKFSMPQSLEEVCEALPDCTVPARQ